MEEMEGTVAAAEPENGAAAQQPADDAREAEVSAWDVMESLNAGGSVAPTNTPVPIESEDGYTTLQEGDSGEAVKALQTKLKELGFFTGTPLGNYKSLTVAAVRAYQAKNGLTVDGVASPALQKRIFEETVPGVTSTPTIEPSGETLKYGSTGE